MAAVSDFFSLGSVVWCRTCYNQEIEGEVQAFDPQTKMLILKCSSPNNTPKMHDVHIVNLSLVSELQVKNEVTTIPAAPKSLNLQRLNTRVRNEVDHKKRLMQAISANVSTEGQSLFIALAKMLHHVRWRDAEIVVWGKVFVSPPYHMENISGMDRKGCEYVRKIVEKHMHDCAWISPSNSTVNNTSS